MPCDVSYKNRFMYIGEVDLSFLTAILNNIIDRDFREQWYVNARDRWAYDVLHSGGNMFDLSLDELLVNPSDEAKMRRLLLCLKKELESYGELIPSEMANSMLPITLRYIKDVSTERLCEIVEKIDSLLPSESSSAEPGP